MTTPQFIFSEANGVAPQITNQLRLGTSRSIYCADCLCGRHFETPSREWVCPECNRHLVLDWSYSQRAEPQGDRQPYAATIEVIA